jgi:hypothetical protein
MTDSLATKDDLNALAVRRGGIMVAGFGVVSALVRML